VIKHDDAQGVNQGATGDQSFFSKMQKGDTRKCAISSKRIPVRRSTPNDCLIIFSSGLCANFFIIVLTGITSHDSMRLVNTKPDATPEQPSVLSLLYVNGKNLCPIMKKIV
jgi:hypothetical protein